MRCARLPFSTSFRARCGAANPGLSVTSTGSVTPGGGHPDRSPGLGGEQAAERGAWEVASDKLSGIHPLFPRQSILCTLGCIRCCFDFASGGTTNSGTTSTVAGVKRRECVCP